MYPGERASTTGTGAKRKARGGAGKSAALLDTESAAGPRG